MRTDASCCIFILSIEGELEASVPCMERMLHLLSVCGLRGEEEMLGHEAPLALDTIRSDLLQALVICFETILYQVA
jgi:hypothetical protein